MPLAADAAGLALSLVARLVTGAQGHWYGSPPKAEQRIYFANHQSHLDWVLIWAALPRDLRATTRPIAARDYWTAGRLKHWITREVFNAVYVSRQRTDDQDPLEPLVEALRHGDLAGDLPRRHSWPPWRAPALQKRAVSPGRAVPRRATDARLDRQRAAGHAGDPERFLERNVKIQWGIMVCVYGLSHAPALLLLDLAEQRERGPFLVFFLVVVVAAQAVALALLAGACGTLGEFVMKALKRDAGVRWWGNRASVTGAVGLLDRVAPPCFAAPVFFHSVRWYFERSA